MVKPSIKGYATKGKESCAYSGQGIALEVFMKPTLPLITQVLLLLMALLWANQSWAFRCKNNLIKEGDFSFEVLERCGEPVIKEVLGYTVSSKHNREFVIERWVYRPQGSYYQILTFVAGVLENIESRSSRQ